MSTTGPRGIGPKVSSCPDSGRNVAGTATGQVAPRLSLRPGGARRRVPGGCGRPDRLGSSRAGRAAAVSRRRPILASQAPGWRRRRARREDACGLLGISSGSVSRPRGAQPQVPRRLQRSRRARGGSPWSCILVRWLPGRIAPERAPVGWTGGRLEGMTPAWPRATAVPVPGALLSWFHAGAADLQERSTRLTRVSGVDLVGRPQCRLLAADAGDQAAVHRWEPRMRWGRPRGEVLVPAH